MRTLTPLRTLTVLVTLVAPTLAGDWPQFRGPFFNGSTDEKGLPASWSVTENIAWVADLPGPGDSTPAVWGNRVFLTSTDKEKEALLALCLDRRTGKPLWTREISSGEVRRDYRSTYAAPSPSTDGKRVFFFYGNGQLIAFDIEGKELWRRNIQKDYGDFAFLWTFSSSPLLYDGKLYLQVLQRDVSVRPPGQGRRPRRRAGSGNGDDEESGAPIQSYLLAMDPATGKTLWRHFRPSDARAESREAFTTPIPRESGGRKEILVIGGDALTAHDPETGKELWRWGTWNPERIGHWRHVPSPVAGEGIVLVCAPKREPVYAIKGGGSGELGAEAIAWVSRDERSVSSDVPTPAFYDGDFFVLSDVRKSLSRVEPATGKVKWTTPLPGDKKYEASPLAADGKIYLLNFIGDAVVVDAKDGDIVSTIPMKATPEYPVRSSIIAAHGQLFIRTNRKLYCVGKSATAQ